MNNFLEALEQLDLITVLRTWIFEEDTADVWLLFILCRLVCKARRWPFCLTMQQQRYLGYLGIPSHSLPVSLFNKPTNWVAQLISVAIKVAVMCSFVTYQTFFWQFKEWNVSDENSPGKKLAKRRGLVCLLVLKNMLPCSPLFQQIRSTTKIFFPIFVW